MAYVVGLGEVDRTQVAVAGGKGAHLGELLRVDGVAVPEGFCVTSAAFERAVAQLRAPSMAEWHARLASLRPGDREAIRALSAEIRRTIEDLAIPEEVGAGIRRALARLGEQGAYAVRSSATAEDGPAASAAGQQDTYLHVVGTAAVLEHVRRCWASLFTERAVTYRLQAGVDHRKVSIAVVVQRMVASQVAGVLFTADPVSGNRKAASVEAVPGLGEALVSGLVTPDGYEVRDGEVVGRTVASAQGRPALTDAQVLRLVGLGRRIEAHLGGPQDIEWCLADDGFWIVQSRPITTLFPIPEAADGEHRVYVSVGHQQMMTDAMRPLGLSLWQRTTPRPMSEAGGRLFVDVTPHLSSPATRVGLIAALGRSDPLIGDALQTVVDRGFLPTSGEEGASVPGVPTGGPPAPIEADPGLVAELIEEIQASIAALRRDIRGRSGAALIEFIVTDLGELRRILFAPRSMQVIVAAMDAAFWLGDHLEAWLGESRAVDTLTQAVPHNVTSEMGLALLDVADAIRPHPDVVAFLQATEDERFLDELAALDGGRAARDAIRGFLDTYGMRCAGEIDITRPRWSERPTTLLPMILGNVRSFAPGEARRRVEQGREEARRTEQEVLERLRALPDGEDRAVEAKAMIDRVRTFAGYREWPKYGMVGRYWIYKQALLEEAGRLVRAGVLREEEDLFFLTLQEVGEAARTGRVDEQRVRERRESFATHQALTPPRVLTSEGEVVAGRYRRDDVPAGALVGLPVSAGTVEGRARVVVDAARADLEAGDILVTPFTDPSWTPLFLAVDGLVTEVGGLMTHGAVIAREYGLPAVVGVQDATRRIRDGQRIRVHGTDGYVELLE